jgi:DNA-binding NtrC family response regulator
VLLCPTSTISPQYLPTRVSRVDDIMACVPIELGTSLAEVERIVIQRTLASVGDNKSEAARILGLSRKALYDKLRLYEGRRVID